MSCRGGDVGMAATMVVVMMMVIAQVTGSPSSSWFLVSQRLPHLSSGNGMPAIQRTDSMIAGQHPTMLVAAPVVIDNTSAPANRNLTCRTLAVDVPLVRRNATAGSVGATHFFLWDADGPPLGASRSVAFATRRETWTVAAPVGRANLTATLLVVRYLLNLTNLAKLTNGTWYLGLYVEKAGWVPGAYDLAEAGGGGLPFRWC